MTTRGLPEIDRLMLHVMPVTESGCWIWTASLNDNGYGNFYVNGKIEKAHRRSFILSGKSIHRAFDLDHLCRVPSCVNPNHLEPVTRKENARRGLRGVLHTSKTHCPMRHEYTEQNSYFYPDGRKKCKTCARDAIKIYRQKIKAARCA